MIVCNQIFLDIAKFYEMFDFLMNETNSQIVLVYLYSFSESTLIRDFIIFFFFLFFFFSFLLNITMSLVLQFSL